MSEDVPDDAEGRVRLLEEILIAACEGHRGEDSDRVYKELRTTLSKDPDLGPLLPRFVRTHRDLSYLWTYMKSISPHWEPRRVAMREAMSPLWKLIEERKRFPIDSVVSDVLVSFDPDGVHSVWLKALGRRLADPEGAITSARTLLETVCKHVLDASGVTYDDKDDLPTLYKATAEQLNLAPSQHSQEAFRRILGGATSVVEGLGSLRNRIGDAHGQGRDPGRKPVRPSPRHAQLAVNMAGTMATFLIETWIARQPSGTT